VDRVGKGIRGAPRDALVADVTPPAVRGAAYGLRQALDTIGAFLGPLLGIALFTVSGDLRTVFAVAIAPGALAVALLVLGVEDPHGDRAAPSEHARFTGSALRSLGAPFWTIVATGVAFTLARLSEAFLVLRAHEAGVPMAALPAVLIAMNLVYAISSAPAGALSDQIDRRWVLAIGLAALVAADLVLADWDSALGALCGAALWGLHMGLSHGLLAAMVADTAPSSLRGTAFGVFHLLSGVALLIASALAGSLWQRYGSDAAFLASASFAAVALIGLLGFSPAPPRDPSTSLPSDGRRGRRSSSRT
jgi:MFS family permease